MPPKARIPAPIDRPLSRAYLRQFTGWSTAYPPGLSDPTSLRVMENVAVTRDGAVRVRPGLRYLSYDEAPGTPLPVPNVTPVFVGKSTITGNYPSVGSSIPLPAGTQVGDLLVFSAMGGYDGSVVACPDSRMTAIDTVASAGHSSGVWVGYATSLGALSVNLNGNYHTIGQFWIGTVTVFRGVEGPLEWLPGSVQATADSSSTTTPQLPASAAVSQSGVICVYESSAGLGGTYYAQDWSKAPAYTSVVADDNSYIETDVAYALGASVPAQTTPNTDTNSIWRAVTFAFSGSTSGTLSGPPGGIGFDRPFVGTHEAFYLNDGTKAYLTAVRETDGTVGFRVLKLDLNGSAMFTLTDPLIDFDIPQGAAVLNFSAATTYVKYLQIDNKIFALSDAGEPMRIFTVGTAKTAKALAAITRPEWDNDDKLAVVQPDATWITSGDPVATRRNRVLNPSFETNHDFWNKSAGTEWDRVTAPTPQSGTRVLRLASKPARTNLATQPLHNVATTGVTGWDAGEGAPTVAANGSYLKATSGTEKGLFYARSLLLAGVDAGESYHLAYDADQGAHVDAKCRVRFFGVNAQQLGPDHVFAVNVFGGTRWASPSMQAPKGAVSARVYIGGENTGSGATSVSAKNLVFCLAAESTAAFHGGSGTNYFWTGTANRSTSVYHPPADVEVWTDRLPAPPAKPLSASIYVRAGSTVRSATIKAKVFDKNGSLITTNTGTPTADVVGSWTRIDVGTVALSSSGVRVEMRVTIPSLARGEYHYLDAALLESGVSTPGTYFDGSTADTATFRRSWLGAEHASRSIEVEHTGADTIPPEETRTADTLVATGGPAVNTYQFGFFYTFNNEVGESAASKVTVQRAQRGWSEWVWETPNVAGEPSGTATGKAELCADQLVAYMPQDVFDTAIAQGATSWNLYMFTWAAQDTVPVTAIKVGTKELPPGGDRGTYGWIRVTPQQSETGDITVLPTLANRYNYSDPSCAGQGLVAADRMILVHDPNAAAVIRWSSNRQGEYTNFTANKGGGYKTLTSGNLYVPASVKLWQNPQSVDTITILCQGTDGQSTGFYMAPAQVASQSEATNIMGFEETTATPGTTSPYGVEVFNNALYHPLDDQLMKSTAANYNINHKSVTDLIRNVWERLAHKEWIISSLHDNRLYYIVHNSDGAPLEDGCNGNEIWVLDGGTDKGTWSRYLIQAHSLRKIEFGGRIYMSVIRPDGIYYLDPDYGFDDVVGTDRVIAPAAIAWSLETNTQGANRAHDAWAHLQQLGVVLGNFTGELRYGIRSWDIHGKPVEVSKIVRDLNAPSVLTWDLEDFLQIRRDLKEWYFFAESTLAEDGTVNPSSGQLNLVQYRYTPSTVNTGYELGSVETFEYGRAEAGAAGTTTNGIPVPLIDTRRP